jgi:hypothetical protein
MKMKSNGSRNRKRKRSCAKTETAEEKENLWLGAVKRRKRWKRNRSGTDTGGVAMLWLRLETGDWSVERGAGAVA